MHFFAVSQKLSTTGAGDGGGGGPDAFGYEQLLCAEDIQRLEHFKAI